MEEIEAKLKEADLRRQVLNFEFLFWISAVNFFLLSLFFYKLSVWFLRKKKEKKKKKEKRRSGEERRWEKK